MAHAERRLRKAQLDALRRRLEDERSRILAVLRTPTAASYDERTGEPIAYERLAAIPWARGAADEEGPSPAP